MLEHDSALSQHTSNKEFPVATGRILFATENRYTMTLHLFLKALDTF
jgi:hypothetical protein